MNSTPILPSIYGIDHPANYITSITNGIFGTVGFLGNGFTIGLLLKNFAQRKPHELILIGICLSDFSSSICSLGQCYFVLNFQQVGCEIDGYFQYIFGPSSMILPCIAMMHRFTMKILLFFCIICRNFRFYCRYCALFNKKILNTFFTSWKIGLYFCMNLISYLMFHVPFITSDALGLDDMGVCGVRLQTTFLKIWFLLNIIYASMAYFISAVCGFKIMHKLKHHNNESMEYIQVLSIFLCFIHFGNSCLSYWKIGLQWTNFKIFNRADCWKNHVKWQSWYQLFWSFLSCAKCRQWQWRWFSVSQPWIPGWADWQPRLFPPRHLWVRFWSCSRWSSTGRRWKRVGRLGATKFRLSNDKFYVSRLWSLVHVIYSSETSLIKLF